eukprot:TRINITY_DN10294_c0_g1_i1.p1 TRINITY_DN10294_c0_g1~~TRINITY_DN10294_c0_g1_i1.p1  ORF type:complete len:313 (-),score=42.20 TRINITY_DN10294_c0_g1_i1:80-1018(-)
MHPAALGSASRARSQVNKPPAVVGNYSAAALKVATNDTQIGQPIFTQTNQPLRDSEGNPFFECHVDGWFCAVRRFVSREMDEDDMEHFEKEITIRESLPNHRNIVRYLFHDFRSGNFSIYTAYYKDTLKDELEGRKNYPLAPKEISKYAYDIVSALSFLHQNSVMHRNLQTLNIFIKRDPRGTVSSLLVGGFDVAKKVTGKERAKTTVGQPAYSAPEVMASNNTQSYDYSVDIYSLGMVLYEMMTRTPPYQNMAAHEIILQKCAGQLLRVDNKTVMNENYVALNEIYERCTSMDPTKRPALKELKEFFIDSS